MGSSHAYTFVDPADWDLKREHTRAAYVKRLGVDPPPEHSSIDSETLEDNERRYERVRRGLDEHKQRLHALQPDVIVMIGDDQNENYGASLRPQFAVFTGSHVDAVDITGNATRSYECDGVLGYHLVERSVGDGFDTAFSERFDSDRLLSHAHQQPLDLLEPPADCKVVPVFVNAIHVPGPEPRRCLDFGRSLRRAINDDGTDKRVVIYASGGWSHFTSGYPWDHYDGSHQLGSIAVDFDQILVERLVDGDVEFFAGLTSNDLLRNGDVEFRQWLIMLGLLGPVVPRWVVYEPFFRAVMGMAVAYWEPVD